MKKYLFFLIASLFLCGAVNAQKYEPHWTQVQYADNMVFLGVAQLDGVLIEEISDPEIDVTSIEVAAFINGECRMSTFLHAVADEAYPYYIQKGIQYEPGLGQPGDEEYIPTELPFFDEETGTTTLTYVTFKMYNHLTGREYDLCDLTNIYINASGYVNWTNPKIVNFNTPTMTLDIEPFTTVDNVPYGYYLIASPFGELDPTGVTNMLANEFDLYYFDQTHELEWINYKPTPHFNLVPGKGYLYANSGDGVNPKTTLTFKGFPESTDDPYAVSLVYDEGATLKGWNLIGNPFAVPAIIDRSFYIMNDDGSEVLADEQSRPIEAMEGVFVEATQNEVLYFTLPDSKKASDRVVINLSKERGNVIDRAIVRFGDGDLLHKFQINENSTKIYMPKNNEDYAILNASEEGQMPVNFKPAENGIYTITVNTENVDLDYLHLIDNLTGADVDLLLNPKYNFNASTTDYASRFVLRFRADASVVANDMFSPMTYRQDGTLAINGIQGESELVIIDMLGRVVSKDAFNITDGIIRNITITPGVYVLRLMNNNTVYTQKIVVE